MKKILVIILFLVVVVALGGCAKKTQPAPVEPPTMSNPPYNDYDASSQVPKKTAIRFVEGVAAGTVVGSVLSSPAPVLGGVIGGAVGGIYTAVTVSQEESASHLAELLQNEDHVQVIQEGNTLTLIVPTDPYYLYNSYELDDTDYVGLRHIAQMVYLHSGNETIYIAGFSDGGIGSERQLQKLSEERARMMGDFLWANGVPLNRIMTKGYGPRYDIADNDLIHGAAMNRRVEIQWRLTPSAAPSASPAPYSPPDSGEQKFTPK